MEVSAIKHLPSLGTLFGECGIWGISFTGPRSS